AARPPGGDPSRVSSYAPRQGRATDRGPPRPPRDGRAARRSTLRGGPRGDATPHGALAARLLRRPRHPLPRAGAGPAHGRGARRAGAPRRRPPCRHRRGPRPPPPPPPPPPSLAPPPPP